jgi:hypothetical protein
MKKSVKIDSISPKFKSKIIEESYKRLNIDLNNSKNKIKWDSFLEKNEEGTRSGNKIIEEDSIKYKKMTNENIQNSSILVKFTNNVINQSITSFNNFSQTPKKEKSLKEESLKTKNIAKLFSKNEDGYNENLEKLRNILNKNGGESVSYKEIACFDCGYMFTCNTRYLHEKQRCRRCQLYRKNKNNKKFSKQSYTCEICKYIFYSDPMRLEEQQSCLCLKCILKKNGRDMSDFADLRK